MKFEIATSIKYGNYKRHLERAQYVIEIIKSHLANLQKEFDFKSNPTIRIRPIRGETYGRIFDKSNKIEIDPRYSFRHIIETIAHELVHSEQYKQGRLVQEYDPARFDYMYSWNKMKFRNPRSHKEYWNLPWEIEARARAKEYVDKYIPLKEQS